MKLPKGYKTKTDNKMTWMGDTDTTSKLIRVNRKLHKKAKKIKNDQLIDTYVHELMHANHPKMKEKTVYKKTPKAVKKMTNVQKHKIYGYFAK